MNIKQFKPFNSFLIVLLVCILSACSHGNMLDIPQDMKKDVSPLAYDLAQDSASTITTTKLMLVKATGQDMIALDPTTSTVYTLTDYQELQKRLFDSKQQEHPVNLLTPGAFLEITHQSSDKTISVPEIQYAQLLEAYRNLLPVYYHLITHITSEDVRLASGISQITLDLSQALNLSQVEKQAIRLLIQSNYGIDCKLATYEELSQQQELSADGLSYPKGLLITINVTKDESKQFDFTITKWHSSYKALGYNSCYAHFQDFLWTYELEGGWIS